MKGDAPTGALKGGLRAERLAALAARPIENDGRGIADAGEGVGHVGDAGDGELAAIGAKRHGADAADVGPEGVVVVEEGRGVELAHLLAAAHVPLLELALEI